MAAFTDSTFEADRQHVQEYIKHRARGSLPDAAFEMVWGEAKGVGFSRSSLTRHREIEAHRKALVDLGEGNWATYTWPEWNYQTATIYQYP